MQPESGIRECWVTGAGGLIGHAVVNSPQVPGGWRPVALTRADLELTDFAAVAARYRQAPPAAIIHCAALSRSPDCQQDPARARLWNVEVTRILAELAADRPLIFLSTDLVFDGRQGSYREGDPVGPLSVYAETKVTAEAVVRRNPGHLVVRTSLNHGTSPTGNRGFNEEMRLAWQAGRTLKLFTDEFRCPIPAVVTARALWEFVAAGLEGSRALGGLVHLAGSERLSRWEIGEALAARHPEAMGRIEPGQLRDYQGAPRAPDTSLDCSRAQGHLSFPLPGYRTWLTEQP
jgi:dTDP-4-dehydrorhamnose reductase